MGQMNAPRPDDALSAKLHSVALKVGESTANERPAILPPARDARDVLKEMVADGEESLVGYSEWIWSCGAEQPSSMSNGGWAFPWRLRLGRSLGWKTMLTSGLGELDAILFQRLHLSGSSESKLDHDRIRPSR